MNTVGVYLEIRAGYCGGLRVLRSAVCTFRTRKEHPLSSPFIKNDKIQTGVYRFRERKQR